MVMKFIKSKKLIVNKYQRNYLNYQNNFHYNQWFLSKILMKYNHFYVIIMLEIKLEILDLIIQKNFYNGGFLLVN